VQHRPASLLAFAPPVPRPSASPRLLPLGALAAGFGLVQLSAEAQTPPVPPAAAAPATSAASAASAPAAAAASAPAGEPRRDGTTLQPISVRSKVETDQDSVRATTSTVGRGHQELRDIPQSVTVVTEKLLEDRRADTVKEALHYTAGISFMAAEGGEEDIRLRGFSLTASGDIFADGIRDPAFYDRDVFNFERIEVMRGSASMLFGRGSTGGVVNQVSKQPSLMEGHEVQATAGSGRYLRTVGDFNFRLSPTSAFRLGTMTTTADNWGNSIDKHGIAPTLRWGINTAHEFSIGYYYLNNDNGIHYGMPWLRRDASGPISATNPGGLVPVSPRSYYGAASDSNAGKAAYGTLHYTHRLAGGGEWHTVLRQGEYERDMRASTIRFCTRSAAAPECPLAVDGPSQDRVGPSTLLNRGTNNKVQDLKTTYVQTNYSNRLMAYGMRHAVLGGVDFAREEFENHTLSLPAGVVLNKNVPRPTLGRPNDGTSVDESLRQRVLNRTFVAKALGVYAQDLVEVVPNWKLLAGLRWDRFEGDYVSPATATVQETRRSRSDSLWSKRFGILYQPTDHHSFYVSYGTSFNTSGELYNYDAPGAKAPPEKSRNIEAGARFDLFEGRLSARAAIFRSTKYNERNRDSPEGQPLVDFILSGERHASGFELDLAGRITPAWEVFGSYAWIPSAKVDKAAFGVAPSGEREGDRPSLTPRHSGSIFTTYQLTPAIRIGGGLNARSSQTPNRNPAGIVAPGFVTGDLLLEVAVNRHVALKLNLINVTDKLYADSLYSGHYIPGQPRTLYATLTARF
jgi:catecholate siderophore receptor